jgi:hypothetical protein
MSFMLSWVNPTQYTDGVAYDGPNQNAGYQIDLDSAPAVSIPLQYGTSFDLQTLASWSSMKTGSHTVALAAVTKGGVVGVFSNPATFPFEAPPMAPTNVRVA